MRPRTPPPTSGSAPRASVAVTPGRAARPRHRQGTATRPTLPSASRPRRRTWTPRTYPQGTSGSFVLTPAASTGMGTGLGARDKDPSVLPRRDRIISKNSLFRTVESYVSKVTAAGQLTLPKKARSALGIEGSDYVEVALVGRSIVIRRLREEEEFLAAIRKQVKKSGLTRARVNEIVKETRKQLWKERYAQAVR